MQKAWLKCFSLGSPKAELEKGIWLQVIYLGEDSRKHWENMEVGHEKEEANISYWY